MNKAGEFVNVEPIPGTLLMIGADYLERWSDGKFRSCVHQVLAPRPGISRQSMVFFVQPDNDVVIRSLNGNVENYTPVKAIDYYSALYGKTSTDKKSTEQSI